jgi:hypothetical protein
LHNSKFIAIHNGKEISDVNSTFSDEHILDNAKILLSGTLGNDIPKPVKIKKFKRFKEIRAGDSWYVGRERWDALAFIPKQNIKVFGIGLYEIHPDGGNFTLSYRYHLLDPNGTETF